MRTLVARMMAAATLLLSTVAVVGAGHKFF